MIVLTVQWSPSLLRNEQTMYVTGVKALSRGSVPASRPTCVALLSLTLRIHVARHE